MAGITALVATIDRARARRSTSRCPRVAAVDSSHHPSSIEFAAVLARPVAGLEHGDDVAGFLGSDRQRFAQQQVVGEVAVESPARAGRRCDGGLAHAERAVVGGDGEVDRCFGVVRDLGHMAAAGNDAVVHQRPVVALDRALGALDVELRAADRAHVALAEGGLAPVVPLHPQAELVGVGRVVPHAVVGAAQHPRGRGSVELQDPVDVVRAPVVDRSAGDRLLRMPGPARDARSRRRRSRC